MEDEQKEIRYHMDELKQQIKPHILGSLETYEFNSNDSIDRLLLRGAEILINRHPYEFNLILANMVKVFGNYDIYDDGAGGFDVNKFNITWLENGYKFD